MEDAFASFGEITDAFIPHRGSRFGFVDFKEPAAATKALKEMHDKHLDDQSKKDAGEVIGVIRAKERPSDKERPVKKEEKPAEKTDKRAPEKKDKAKAPDKKEAKKPSTAPPAKSAGGAGKERPKERSSAAVAKEDARAPRFSKKVLDGVCDKLFGALSNRRWEQAAECFAPAAECFSPQRTGARAQSFDGFKKTMGGMIGLLGAPEYKNTRRLYGSDSVVEQHTTRFAQSPDTTVEAEACVLLRLNQDGLVTRMDEYLDPTAVLKAVQIAANAAKKK